MNHMRLILKPRVTTQRVENLRVTVQIAAEIRQIKAKNESLHVFSNCL